MSESAGAFSAVTGDGPRTGFNFYSYNTPGDHAHLVATLLGDGANPVDGPHAVYAMPLRLSGGGLGDSLTYYILYGREIPLNDPVFTTAITTAQSVFFATPGDANIDGKVDARDLGALASHWQHPANWAGGDFNFDGSVDISDLYLLASNWHSGAALMNQDLARLSLPSSVPEPIMSCGAAFAGFVFLGTRRRVRAMTSTEST
jgi:hypothetical protein